MGFKERLIDEKIQLCERMNKLSIFMLNNEEFESLTIEQQELLQLQYHAMSIYHMVLEKRLKLLV